MRGASPAGEGPQVLGRAALHLSFDDGPDPAWTPRVLEALREAGARASFFMIGERVLAEPDLARAVIEAGHEVQLHCHQHVRHSQMTEDEIEADSGAALQALRAIGAEPRLWRTPWGVTTQASTRVAARHGLGLRRWSVDTHDWRGDSTAAMLEAVGAQLVEGGVVLMHDGLGPGSRRDGAANTLQMISVIARRARHHGLMLTPMPQPDQDPEGSMHGAAGGLAESRT